jgi:type I restriction-modification system, M subunit
MTAKDRQALGKALWAVADELRGSMNADDFRDYMLSFLFLRYLSGNYEKHARELLGGEYPGPDAPLALGQTPLQYWYEKNPQDVATFETEMNNRVHYVIKPEYLWSHIAEMARTQDGELLNTLQQAFKHIEEDSFRNTFRGLFSEVNLASDKLGKEYRTKNDMLCTIISKINEGIADFSTDADSLGDAYEYLIAQFAAGSGKKAGEFYTPQAISTILARIVVLDSQDPTRGPRQYMRRVLDFACGSGSLLLNVLRQMKDSKGIGTLYGQELNITTYNLARMNMLLHGVKDDAFKIFHGNTLTNEWTDIFNPNDLKKIEFDAIVANPPFSLKWNPREALAQDPRFGNYGLAPKKAADMAFLLHGFHYLRDNGTMAIILPHGVLFRGGVEERIRRKLIDDGHIDAVIGLPPKLFFSTGIPVCILVLKKCVRPDDVLFIDASREYAKDKKQNRLRMGENGEPDDIAHIIDTYSQRREEARYSRRVPIAEIRQNDYNLNIPRYIDTYEEEEPIDLHDVMHRLHDLEARRADLDRQIDAYFAELGLTDLVK